MITRYVAAFAALLFFAFASVAVAKAPEFRMIPEKTRLSFIAKQSGAAVEGKFTDISGQIFFDPEKLGDSSVHIEIKPASVNSADATAQKELPSATWFDVAQYPLATFDCKEFVQTKPKEYEARGTLTIRGQKQPAVLAFTLLRYDAEGANIEGKTTIKRTLFGVGQGEWKETNVVADEVVVNVNLEAVRVQ